MADSDEETYTVPLRDQRYFGAGIKRQRVHFVPSSSSVTGIAPPSNTDGSSSASATYLSIVLGKAQSQTASAPETETLITPSKGTLNHVPNKARTSHYEQSQTEVVEPVATCSVCSLPINSSETPNAHESSLVHQICLPHSHPPSALDRKRKGIGMLQSYGWDPDQRVGLGASGEGIIHPIKPKEKRDTVGLGVGREDEAQGKKRSRQKQPPKRVEKLDAGKIRKMEQDGKRRDQKLREMFYASEDLEKYLGGG